MVDIDEVCKRLEAGTGTLSDVKQYVAWEMRCSAGPLVETVLRWLIAEIEQTHRRPQTEVTAEIDRLARVHGQMVAMGFDLDNQIRVVGKMAALLWSTDCRLTMDEATLTILNRVKELDHDKEN